MLLSLAAAILVACALQSPAPDRSRAESLARSGQTLEAMALFTKIAELDPSDIEARLWVARLALRLGRTEDAESGFRSVLREHPNDVDARIGLGMALTRKGAWREALEALTAAERDAGENADLFAALARAYRRSGEDGRALEYFHRARALSPDDPDIAAGFEGVARTYGHWVAVEGMGQGGASGSVGSGTATADVRVTPWLHLQTSARVQQGPGYSDTVAGGGGVWHAARNTTATFHVLGGPGNTAQPTSDIGGDLTQYAGIFEIGAAIRRLTFVGVDVVAASPTFAWDTGRWRLDSRYTYSKSSFQQTGQSSGDNSVVARETWQAWPRLALQGSYAFGIESFEDLTADRINALGANTMAVGLRWDVPSLTRITTTWEHQWRSNATRIDRITVSFVQSIP
ncbi:MAG TPA: tetratricopeptide repeat protein [Vicinamibacterales bacterium]|jgi:tetratricopeptide (TPR) repeat protein